MALGTGSPRLARRCHRGGTRRKAPFLGGGDTGIVVAGRLLALGARVGDVLDNELSPAATTPGVAPQMAGDV